MSGRCRLLRNRPLMSKPPIRSLSLATRRRRRRSGPSRRATSSRRCDGCLPSARARAAAAAAAGAGRRRRAAAAATTADWARPAAPSAPRALRPLLRPTRRQYPRPAPRWLRSRVSPPRRSDTTHQHTLALCNPFTRDARGGAPKKTSPYPTQLLNREEDCCGARRAHRVRARAAVSAVRPARHGGGGADQEGLPARAAASAGQGQGPPLPRPHLHRRAGALRRSGSDPRSVTRDPCSPAGVACALRGGRGEKTAQDRVTVSAALGLPARQLAAADRPLAE
jgi:hypothetical protein